LVQCVNLLVEMGHASIIGRGKAGCYRSRKETRRTRQRFVFISSSASEVAAVTIESAGCRWQ
jgi:hypothetical protein